MAEPKAKSGVSVEKALPWLKQLQEALDDDESSDSSSQSPDMTSEKVMRKNKSEKEGEERVTKRLRQPEGNDSGDELSEGGNDAKETHRRRPKKLDKLGTLARRRRPVKAAKEEQNKELKKSNPTNSAAAKAAVLKEQLKQNLYVRRAATRDNDRNAFKLTQEESSETLKGKERSRVRATRLAWNEQNLFAANEANVEVNSERRRQLSPRLTARRNSTDELSAKRKLRRTAALSKVVNKIEYADLPIVSIGNAPDSLKQDEDDEVKMGSCSVAKTTPVEPTRHAGKKQELRTTPEPIEQEAHDGVSFPVTKNRINELDKPERNGEPETTPPNPEEAKIDVIAQVKTIEDAQKFPSPEKPETTDAAQICLKAALTPSVAPSDPVKFKSLDKMKIEPFVAVKAAPKLVHEAGDIERQAESSVVTQNADGSVQNEDGDEKNSNEEKWKDLMLEMIPIPRRRMKAGDLTVLSTAESFVIPKRSFGNSDKAGQMAVAQVSRVRTGKPQASVDKNSLGPPVFVTMPPLPSPESSPKLSRVADPIRPLTTRLKKSVPLKTASIPMQDRALMRLSRKRNSIFIAAMELAAQAPDFRSNKERMMGYEVYDIDGKALPDLISQFSCATKREMASHRESYAASFFGVSLSAPKAIGKTSSAVDECGDIDFDTRKISCYEELRFNRPEDREFYQRRMYGTAFIPQKLRGWITLIVRNARFERKSTGIRFNQDRDREEFAASLSKRYTLNTSVPRCDIPRENWQKLMRNKPGSVYLHYYNREDAEQASHIFRDDLGHPLELRLNLKAGVVIRASSFSAAGRRFQRTPCRSRSSERSVPESSPSSSQNGSARTWRRERLPMLKSDNRYSRYDCGAPPPLPPWSRGERRYDTHDGGGKHSRAMAECRSRSRSRSRSKSFYGWQNDPDAHEGRVDQGRVERNSTSPLVSDARERTDSRNQRSSSAVYSNTDTPARKRARSPPRSPRRCPTFGDRGKRELNIDDDGRGQEDGEITSRSDINPVRTMTGRDERSGLHRARSPSRRWQQEPSNTEESQRRNKNYLRARSRSPQHRFNQQRFNRNMDMRRSRSRSCSRPETLPGRGGDHSDQYKGHRVFREFDRAGAYDDSTRERRIRFDKGRGDYNGHRGGLNSRSRQ